MQWKNFEFSKFRRDRETRSTNGSIFSEVLGVILRLPAGERSNDNNNNEATARGFLSSLLFRALESDGKFERLLREHPVDRFSSPNRVERGFESFDRAFSK